MLSMTRILAFMVAVASLLESSSGLPWHSSWAYQSFNSTSGAGVTASAPSSAAASMSAAATTTYYLTSTSTDSVTLSGSCGACTINAPNAALLYWDSLFYTYSIATTPCPDADATTTTSTFSTTQTPFSITQGPLGAVETRTVHFQDPALVIVSTWFSTETKSFTETETTIVSNAYDTITSTILNTDTFIEYSLSTPTRPPPTDSLQADVSFQGTTYQYSATYPTPYVYYSIYEVTQCDKTSTITVPVPFISAYAGNPDVDWAGHPTATGALPAYLIEDLKTYENISIGNCVIGTFQGTPTIEVGVLYSDPAESCAAPAHTEVSVSGLGVTISPTAAIVTTQPTSTLQASTKATPTTEPEASPTGKAPTTSAIAKSSPIADTNPTTVNSPSISPASSIVVAGESPSAASTPLPSNLVASTPAGIAPLVESSSAAITPTTSTPASSTPPEDTSAESTPFAESPSAADIPTMSVAPVSNSQVPTAVPNVPSNSVIPTASSLVESKVSVSPSAVTQTPSILTIADVPVAVSSNNVIFNSQTIQIPSEGSSLIATIVNGQPIVVNPSQIIGAGTTVSISILPSLSGAAQSLAPLPLQSTLTVANVPIAISSNNVVINSQTIQAAQGSPPITTTINGQSIVINPSQIIASGTTVELVSPPPSSTAALISEPLPLITFGSSVITANSQSQFIVSGQTLSPGGSALTIGGTKLSLAPSATAIVIGSSTAVIAAAPSLQALSITLGSSIITANSRSQFLISGQTLSPGGPALTIGGTQISLAPSATAIVIGGSTAAITSASTLQPPSITIGSSIITANPKTQFIISGQTLSPGGSALAIGGTQLSLAPSATAIVIGSSTIPLSTTLSHPPSITLGSSTLTANAQSEFLIGGQTLSPGGPALTISNTKFSLAPSASAIEIGASTIPLLHPLPSITLGSSTLTANAQSEFIIAGQTLSPGGPALTISGTALSLAPSASDVVIGGSTFALVATGSPVANSTGVAGSGVVSFTGAAGGREGVLPRGMAAWGVGLWIVWGLGASVW